MPRYEFVCNCQNEPKTFVISLSFSDYKAEIPCPCGNGTAKRVFNSFNVQEGLSAKEKQFGKYRVSDATEAGATGAAEFAGIAAGKFKLRVS